MKIILTESQYEKVSGELDEALGIPSGIMETSERLYDELTNQIKNFEGDLSDIEDTEFEFEDDFKISDVSFDKVNIVFDLQINNSVKKLEIYSLYYSDETEVTDDFKLKSVKNPKEVKIGFRVVAPPNSTPQDLYNRLIEDRKANIPHLSHELKHYFDSIKKIYRNPKSFVDYKVTQELRNKYGFVSAFNEFLFSSYFIHIAENLVRPTEFGHDLKINNISKKEFLDFFLNSNVVKELKKTQNFSYDKFKEELSQEENIKKIRKVFHNSNIPEKSMTDEEVVETLLDMFYHGLKMKKVDTMFGMIQHVLFQKMLSGADKNDFLDKYISEISKYGDDYDKFFKNEEKLFHRISTKMIKKLAKLYASIE